MAKKIEAYVKLQVKAGEANPAPPIGTALGPRGVNIMEFCKAFNAQTTQGTPGAPPVKKGTPLPVVITIYSDRSFTFIIKTPPASFLIRDILNLPKGSSIPHTNKVGRLNRAQLEQIAKLKTPDLTAAGLEAAVRTIAGTARSMGVDVDGVEAR